MAYITLDDFKGGKYNIPDSGSIGTAKLQDAINRWEKPYIYKLLGATLGDLFYTYITAGSPPVNTDYNKIRDAFAMDNPDLCGKPLIQSLGVKEYLKAGIFYEFNKSAIITTIAGAAKPDVETAKKSSAAETMRFAENKFNDVLETIEAIQWYCINNESAFPDFNGQRITVKASNLFI